MKKKKGDKGMKNLKKKLMYSIAVSTLLLGTTIGVFASWSGQINVQPPGWGGSVVSWSGVTKTSNSSKFAISGIKEPNTLDPYAQLVNSNAAAKSSWCAIRQGRASKEGPNCMIFTSNKSPSQWKEDFDEDDTLLCALDRIFDNAIVYMMDGKSYRGRKLETVAVKVGSTSDLLDPVK